MLFLKVSQISSLYLMKPLLFNIHVNFHLVLTLALLNLSYAFSKMLKGFKF